MIKLTAKFLVHGALILAAATLVACGEDDDDKDGDVKSCGIDCLGYAKVVAASTDEVSLSFAGATSGSQFVIMPYYLGNIGTVDGAGAEEFDIRFPDAPGAAGLKLNREGYAPTSNAFMTPREYDHGLRVLWNRFDPGQSEAGQGSWFWQLATDLDETTAGLKLTTSSPSVSESFRRRLQVQDKVKPQANLTTAGECPTEIPVPNFEDDVVTIDPANLVSEPGFCIAYLSDPVSGGTKEEIKASMTAIIDRYKKAIYGDEFAAVGSYVFKPILVNVAIDDPNVWNTDDAVLQLSGVHVSSISTRVNMPVIFVAADFKALPAYKDSADAELKALWHGTVAHEMQHVVMDYYRVRSGGTAETVSIDEGVAHFMEDVFGYGEENFPFYAGAALKTFPDGLEPFLKGANAQDLNGGIARGFAHSMLYYLQSRKGGVEFSNGVVAGGDGFKFIKGIVTSKSTLGAKTLSTAFGGNWTTTVGEYLAAIVVDGTSLAKTAEAQFISQKPVTGVADLNGSEDKTFGMSFNGYLGDITRLEEFEEIDSLGGTVSLFHYGTKPTIYTVSDPAKALTVEFPDATGAGVTVVRIK